MSKKKCSKEFMILRWASFIAILAMGWTPLHPGLWFLPTPNTLLTMKEKHMTIPSGLSFGVS